MGIDPWTPDSVRTPEFLEMFRQLNPDIGVVVAYGKILPPEMLAVPALGCVNVHASLLPELRGAAPIQWAVARGYTETGVTLMQMDEGMDTGPILLQDHTTIGKNETASNLAERLSIMGAEILRKGLPALAKGVLSPSAQDDSLATYAPMLNREDGQIDWNFNASEIANRVRGFTPWPGTYTTWKGKRLLVNTADMVESPVHNRPGEVLEACSDGILVACGAGALKILSLKPEGSREMTAEQFLAGHRLSAGDVLGY
jgi:methionyl-tRNA formyltransferase